MRRISLPSLLLTLRLLHGGLRAVFQTLPGDTGHLSRRQGDRVRLRRRHLDRTRGRRRSAPADLQSSRRVAALVFARRKEAGVHLNAHRRRRHLCADARDRHTPAPHVLRLSQQSRRLVTRRPVDLLHLEHHRRRRAGRHPARSLLRRHAARGLARALPQRVRISALTGRQSRSLLVAKGISSSQWWRNGHAHIDETELWLKPLVSPSSTDAGYRRLLSADAKHAWPMWSPDGKTLFYMSDKSGAENIWSADTATGAEHQVTHFTSGRCLWPTISYDGRSIVFERHFAIWKLDTHSGKASEVAITLLGAPSAEGVTHTPLTHWRDLAISPDGNKLAVVDQGDVFATGTKTGGEAQRLTRTDAAESDSAVVAGFDEGRLPLRARWWLQPLSIRLHHAIRACAHSRHRHRLRADMVTGRQEHRLHSQPQGAARPLARWLERPRPRTRRARQQHDRVVAGLALGCLRAHRSGRLQQSLRRACRRWRRAAPANLPRERRGCVAHRLVAGWQVHPLRHRAAQRNATDCTRRSHPARPRIPRRSVHRTLPQAVDAGRTRYTQRTRHNTGVRALHKARSGSTCPDTRLRQNRRSRPPQKPQSTTHIVRRRRSSPHEIVFEGIRERLTLLPINLNCASLHQPGRQDLAFVASVADQVNIYTYSLDELSREPASPRQLTSTPGFKSDIAWSPDSKTIYYLEGPGGMGGGGNAGGEAPRAFTPSLSTRAHLGPSLSPHPSKSTSITRSRSSSRKPGAPSITASSSPTSIITIGTPCALNGSPTSPEPAPAPSSVATSTSSSAN